MIAAAHPDDAQWNLETMLLASIVDQLRVANWQRAADEDTPPPIPIPRPGINHNHSTDNGVDNVDGLEVYTDSLPAIDESGVITGVETSIDELNAWLGWD